MVQPKVRDAAKLLSRGFAEVTPNLNLYLMRNPGVKAHTFLFYPVNTMPNPKYSVYQIFGRRIRLRIMDNPRAKAHAASYLERLFLVKVGRGNKNAQRAFMMFLHEYNLHSSLCRHVRKKQTSLQES